jgi:hypothetical protein
MGSIGGLAVTSALPGGEAARSAESALATRATGTRTYSAAGLSSLLDSALSTFTTLKDRLAGVRASHPRWIWPAVLIALAALAWTLARNRRRRKWWFHGHA